VLGERKDLNSIMLQRVSFVSKFSNGIADKNMKRRCHMFMSQDLLQWPS